VANNRLVEGYLIMVCRDSDTDTALDSLDANRLTVEGDGLKIDGQPVQNTYMVYNISLDNVRGLNSRAPWYKKFQQSLTVLDELRTTIDDGDRKRIFNAAVKTCSEGSALIDDDPTYLQSERDSIKSDVMARVYKKYADITAGGVKPEVAVQPAAAVMPPSPHLNPKFAKASFSEISSRAKDYSQQLAEAGLTLSWDSGAKPPIEDIMRDVDEMKAFA
jgi:hypothetical protein